MITHNNDASPLTGSLNNPPGWHVLYTPTTPVSSHAMNDHPTRKNLTAPQSLLPVSSAPLTRSVSSLVPYHCPLPDNLQPPAQTPDPATTPGLPSHCCSAVSSLSVQNSTAPYNPVNTSAHENEALIPVSTRHSRNRHTNTCPLPLPDSIPHCHGYLPYVPDTTPLPGALSGSHGSSPDHLSSPKTLCSHPPANDPNPPSGTSAPLSEKDFLQTSLMSAQDDLNSRVPVKLPRYRSPRVYLQVVRSPVC